jgi:SAM-dependent methyltransferase
MHKSNLNSSSFHQANSGKEHFLAWDKEYTHLKWGGPASVKDTQNFLLPESRVLDAGSGNGRYLGELARHYNSVGVDVSLTALYNSRIQLAKSFRFTEHVGASVSDLPFKDRVFDGILCYGVLQHLFKEERVSAVREFRRVLRKNGIIFFEAFGHEDMRCGGENSNLYEENTFSRQNGIIYHYFTKEEVSSLFRDFEIIELENVIKEKIFRGEIYRRHMIKGIFRKS